MDRIVLPEVVRSGFYWGSCWLCRRKAGNSEEHLDSSTMGERVRVAASKTIPHAKAITGWAFAGVDQGPQRRRPGRGRTGTTRSDPEAVGSIYSSPRGSMP